MRVEFHPEATAEAEQSTAWYSERSSNAALGFTVALSAAVASIVADPNRFFRIHRECRAGSLVGYPFQVIFRLTDDRIQILAVAHAKRRPGYWKDRL